jgi:hypothetical protein
MTTTSHIQASGHRRLALVAALAAALGLMAGGYGVTSATGHDGVELASAMPMQPTPFSGCTSSC